MSYEAKLAELGYVLDPLELEMGRLVHAIRVGNLVQTSGQVSRLGKVEVIGKVGTDLTVEQGYEGAKLSALGCLRAAKSLLGSLDEIVRVVRVTGMVNVAPGFTDTPGVVHGASDLFLEVFGDAGRHTRSAIGVQLPFDFAVVVEATFEVR